MASKVHRIRFYNPKPQSINCASYNQFLKVVAVARADASIEIWDLSYAPYLIKFIPGVENGSIEALSWVNDRLLSTGLGGALVEWDLNNLSLKRTVLLTGYAAWCLDVNTAQTLVAVGTEQGYVNLYSVENEDIEYRKLFDKQEGRIICCKFDKTGNILVTGSTNTIRVWNVATGQATTRISTSRRGKESIVWSIGVFSDNTIVSGEGQGRLTFWDITTGDQIESFTTHKKDILSIVVSEKEDKLYCSGVDPVIVQFVKVVNSKDKAKCAWTKHVQIHNHEHDVRCLALQGEKLISVGVDGYLTLSSYPPKWTLRVPPLPPHPRSAVSAEKKLLLLKYSNHLEVWKLGKNATNEHGEAVFMTGRPSVNTPKENKKDTPNEIYDDNEETDIKSEFKTQTNSLKVAEAPLKLVSVQTKGKKQIRCCEISPNGEFIVYSTDTHIRMLKLEMDEDESRTFLSKVPVSGVPAATHAAFTADSRLCVLAAPGALRVLAVDSGAGAAPAQTIVTDKYLKAATMLHLVASAPCASGAAYLLAADTAGGVAAWARRGSRFEPHAALPSYHCVPAALAVDAAREIVYVLYVDQKIIEFDLVSRKLVNDLSSRLPPQWYARPAAAAAAGLAARPGPGAGALVVADHAGLTVLERGDGKEQDEPIAKKKSLNGNRDGNCIMRNIPVKYLAGFHWLGAGEAALLQLPPEHILLQLPPALKTKTTYAPP